MIARLVDLTAWRNQRKHTQVQAWLLAVPIAAANLLAAFGQALWAYGQLQTRVWPAAAVTVAVLSACVIESFALVVTAVAHQARLAGDAALPTQTFAYLIAGGAGTINYSHWSTNWTPTGLALLFSAFSVGSPILWGFWSKSRWRTQLREQGIIDRRAVRFPLAMWANYPYRTFMVRRIAIWEGIMDPAEAIRRWEAVRNPHSTNAVHREVRAQEAATAAFAGAPSPDNGQLVEETRLAAPESPSATASRPKRRPSVRTHASGDVETLVTRLASEGMGRPAIRMALKEDQLSLSDGRLNELIRLVRQEATRRPSAQPARPATEAGGEADAIADADLVIAATADGGVQ
jgi:hypothetical protein